MNNTKCYNSTNGCPFRITFDEEMSENLSNEFESHTHALWSDWLDAGVYISTSGRCGVYGKDDDAVDALNEYWVQHEEEIAETIGNAEDFEAACTIIIGVISGFVAKNLRRAC